MTTRVEALIWQEVEEGREVAPFLFISLIHFSEMIKKFGAHQYISHSTGGYEQIMFYHNVGSATIIIGVPESGDFYMFGTADTYHSYNLENAIWGDDDANSNL